MILHTSQRFCPSGHSCGARARPSLELDGDDLPSRLALLRAFQRLAFQQHLELLPDHSSDPLHQGLAHVFIDLLEADGLLKFGHELLS